MTVVFFNPYADSDMKGAARRIMFVSRALQTHGVATRAELRNQYRSAAQGPIAWLAKRLGFHRLGYFLRARQLCAHASDLVVTEVIFAPTWRKNLILTIHDLKAFDSKATRGGRLRRWAYLVFARLAHQIVVVSESVREDLIRSCRVSPIRIAVIPNGISEQHLQLAAASANQSKAYDFVYVSSFAPHKRHAMLLRAAPAGARIALVGRDLGSLPEIMSEIERRAGEITVHVLNDIATDEQLFAVLGQSRCGVFPSVFEGFGIPILEYAAAGLYVIASDIAPFLELSEFIDRLVATDNQAELARAMNDFLLQQPACDEGRFQRLRDSRYTEEAVAYQFSQLAAAAVSPH